MKPRSGKHGAEPRLLFYRHSANPLGTPWSFDVFIHGMLLEEEEGDYEKFNQRS